MVLAINKPLEWTSFDVVNKIRWRSEKRLGVKKFKVGHAGTLDPLATGVLSYVLEKATKTIESWMTTTNPILEIFDLEQPLRVLIWKHH